MLNTISPYLDLISAELSLKLMVPCSFKQMDLSRLDAKTRFDIYKTGVEIGALTPEEIKSAEGF